MTISHFDLTNSIVYDLETLPNVFLCHIELLHSNIESTWEISHYRDDRIHLLTWLDYLYRTQTPMIGFNNLYFDYPVLHFIWKNPNCTVEEIYQYAMSIINSINKFAHLIKVQDRLAPQIDLFKIHHFDNKAKTTSLKALQINMRLSNVIELDIPFGIPVTEEQTNNKLIPYNKWDVKSTKQFAFYSMQAIEFRIAHIDQFGLEVLNYNDSKIGSKILENRLGEDLCYEKRWTPTGFNGEGYYKREMRQTYRREIILNDIIFPYIKFNNLEFQRILDYMRRQILTPADIADIGNDEGKPQAIQTKGVLSGLTANVNGIEFRFGTGGIHGSIERKKIIATDDWLIRDIDVTGLYPSIAIVNHISPEHLGEKFVQEYAKLPIERKEWQKKKGKKCVEANALKLASNGTYGNTNSVFSIFYDPQYTMTITINGQLSIAMLAEWLMTVPTLNIIQVNTDGITYNIHKDFEPYASNLCKEWEKLTKLTLEDTNYKRMWIRDVNSYIAEDNKGNLKLKGAYWYPDSLNYAQSISESQPPAWHKDLGNCISIRAAVMAMVHNISPETIIKAHSDPFDFMLRVKVGRADELLFDSKPIQKTSRYFVAKRGGTLIKVSPPAKGAEVGVYKRANNVSEAVWIAVNAELAAKATPNAWDARIHTKNKSKYVMRETGIQAGYKVIICNDVKDFDFNNINYDYYINEANKLIIG